MTLAIPLALMLAAPAPRSAAANDARLTAIVEANKAGYESCIGAVDAKYPREDPPSKAAEKMTLAEAQAAHAKAMRMMNDAVTGLEEEGKCWRAFESVVQPKLKAAGASPDRARTVMTAWAKARTVKPAAKLKAPESTPPSPDPAAQDASPIEPIRVGGAVPAPKKIKDVAPEYPQAAREARVQGVVILECVVNTGGRVTDVKVLRGFPLLDDAAMAAARQWLYEPTVIDGRRVPVITTATVAFRLD